MKRDTAILALGARSVLGRGLALLAATVVAQCLLFAQVIMAAPEILVGQDMKISYGMNYEFDRVFSTNGVSRVALLSFVVLLLLLSGVGSGRGSRVDYTLSRLSVRERTVSLLWAGHNLGWLLLFWAVELVTALALMGWYLSLFQMGDGISYFIVFHVNDFLRMLMPLEEGWQWLSGVISLAALALLTADLSSRGRRHMPVTTGMFLCGMIFLPALTWSGMGSIGSNVASLVLSAIGIWYALDDLWGGVRNER